MIAVAPVQTKSNPRRPRWSKQRKAQQRQRRQTQQDERRDQLLDCLSKIHHDDDDDMCGGLMFPYADGLRAELFELESDEEYLFDKDGEFVMDLRTIPAPCWRQLARYSFCRPPTNAARSSSPSATTSSTRTSATSARTCTTSARTSATST